MEIHNIYFSIFANPYAIKNYRELQSYYMSKGLLREANAFGKLIKVRVQKNDASNNSNFVAQQ